MKRFLSLAMAVLMTALLSFPALTLPVFAADTDTLIQNPGFDDDSGWGNWSNGEDGDWDCAVEDGAARVTNRKPVATNFNQEIPVLPGHTYRFTVMAKTDSVTSEGQGALFACTSYFDESDSQTEVRSPALYETNDWTELSLIATIPEDSVRTVVNVRIYFAAGTAWFDDLTVTEINADDQGSREVAMTVTDTPNRYPLDAFGCEWDPKLLFKPSIDRGVDFLKDPDLIADRIKTLNIGRVRMMMMPNWYEPRNDNDDPDLTNWNLMRMEDQGKLNEMRSVWRYLDICQAQGVRVTLTWWGAETGVANAWLACPGVTDWVSAPNDLEEMAENISAFMKYALKEKGYTCIDSIILQNEPYYSYQTARGEVDFEHYVEYYKTVRARLDRDGMPGIRLIASDDSDYFGWFQKCVDALSDTVDGFNSHSYLYRAADYGLDVNIQSFVSRRTETTDKPFFFGEFGDGSTVGAYSTLTVEDYERGLFLGIHAVNSLKSGSTGSLYWPLHDVYYYDGKPDDGNNGGLMKMGLFAFKDEDWRVRPTYHAWGLVNNHALHGSQVFDITDDSDWVEAVALQTPAGHWTVLADNRANEARTLTLTAPFAGEMQLTVFQESAVTRNDTLIQPTAALTPADGAYTFELPPMSFAVLSNVDESDREAAKVFEPLDVHIAEDALETPPEALPTPAPTRTPGQPSGSAEKPYAGTVEAMPVWGWVLVAVPLAAGVVLLVRKQV